MYTIYEIEKSVETDFAFSKISYFARCAGAGTGRQARLRAWCPLRAWRFDSSSAHNVKRRFHKKRLFILNNAYVISYTTGDTDAFTLHAQNKKQSLRLFFVALYNKPNSVTQTGVIISLVTVLPQTSSRAIFSNPDVRRKTLHFLQVGFATSGYCYPNENSSF